MKKLFPYLFLTLFLIGCPSPKPIQKEEPPSPPSVKEIAPEITVRFASLDISKYTKRIEKDDLKKFITQLKSDSIDILTIQGITRYPGLKTRIDIVEELAATADMRKSFGETINLSGRQNGNGVFTIYPIRSSENLQFEKLKSTGFEAALQTIVDCGTREIVVVSTQISEKASKDDIISINASLGQLTHLYPNQPIIISGNIANAEASRSMLSYENITLGKGSDSPTVCFSKNESLKLLTEQIVLTNFGKMTIVNFGIYRQTQP